MRLPRITVVTPSFNQAAFLETTILSVLGQCYPNLEYMVMDGGSTDGSVEIIRRYEAQLAHWTSAPDGGQSAAINTAFARATGDILCWINSDDFLLPGTLLRMARQFADHAAEPRLIYGSCLFFEDAGKRAKVVRARAFDPAVLRLSAFIIQPSAFWTRTLWERTGPLDPALSFAFDWDWFVRASTVGSFERCEEILSAYRLHAAHKSGSGGEERRQEIICVARRHATPEQVAAYEFLNRHWVALEKLRGVEGRLQQQHIPGAEIWARVVTRFPGRPPGVSAEDLKLCEGMLHGS
ncbi:MAG: glycosyltransferase family 2 protein [Chthoniobacteraceae bacterium]